MPLPVINRSCGACTVCCSFMSIDDDEANFHKPVIVDCENLSSSKGCTIYDTKPKVCTGFYCMWMVDHVPGMFKSSDRPDLVNVMVVMNNPESDWVKYSKTPSFTAYEVVPGAFKSYWGDKLLRKVTKKWLTILMDWKSRDTKYVVGSGTEFRGPGRLIDMVAKFNGIEDYKHGKDK